MSEGRFRILLAVLLVAVLIGLGLVVLGYSNTTTAAAESHRALCALHHEDVKRLHDTQEFLRKHKDSPILKGITKGELQRSVDGLKTQVRALNGVQCG